MSRVLNMVLFLWLAAAVLGAQERSGVDDAPPARAGEVVGQLEETVVVSATRSEIGASQLPANTTVLEEALENHGAVMLDDALRQVPGFSLFRRSSSLTAHPTSQGVSLRGIGPSGVSRTLVLLDGVVLNDAFGGWVYWSRVPKTSLERVEIVRGGGSHLWGNFALGGVIQLFTEQPTKAAIHGELMAGERATWRAGATGFAPLSEGFDLRLSAETFDTDGYVPLSREQRGTIDVPAWVQSDVVSAGLRYAAGESHSISLRAETFDEERSNGTRLTGNETALEAVSLFGSHVASDRWSIDWTLGGSDQTFVNRFSAQAADRQSENPALEQYDVPSEAVEGSLRFALSPLGASGASSGGTEHQLSAGVDVRETKGSTNEQYFFTGQFNRERRAGGEQQLQGAFVHDFITAGLWRIDVGARVDRWDSRDGSYLELDLTNGTVRRDESFADRDATEVSPRIGVVRELEGSADSQQLFASFYRSFRAPTINELYRPFRVRSDITAANETLVPETLTGFELGWRRAGSRQRQAVTLFQTELDDPIANVTLGFGPGLVGPCGFTPRGGSCRQRQNLERTQVRGAEAETQHQLGPIAVNVSWLYSDTEVQEARAQPELVGKQLAQVPEHQGVLRVDWNPARAASQVPGGLLLSIQARFVDSQFEDDLNQRAMDNFLGVDVHVSGQLAPWGRWFVAAQNLFDEEFATQITGNGLVSLGAPRMVHGGLRIRWDG